jgi:hypothetical protein
MMKQQLLKVYQQQRTAAETQLTGANKLTGDEGMIARAVAQADLDQVNSKIRELQRSLDDLGQSLVQFGADARQAMEGGLAKGIETAILRTGKLRDVWVGFVGDLVGAGSRMLSRNAMQALFGDWMTQQTNGTSGALGGVFGAAASGVG